MAKTLRPGVAPFLPVAPKLYEPRYQDQFSNVLRLYFTQLENFLQTIMENSGGRFLNFPHIFAANTANRYADGDNTPTTVEWNTLAAVEGFSLDTATDAAIAEYSGGYNVTYRLQAENTDSVAHEVYAWMRVNGTDVPNSCTRFTVAAGSYNVCASSIQANLNGGGAIQLYWATDKAATSGGGLGVFLEAYPAQTSPFAAPATPSAYGSISFVSELSQ